MQAPRYIRVHYCTSEVRSLMMEVPLDQLLQQGSKTLSAAEFDYLLQCLSDGRTARIDGPDCWFEYEVVRMEAAS